MRAIGQISNHIAATAILAGAALWAGASVTTTKAHAAPPEPGQDAHSNELAMVMPRQAFNGSDDLPLPKPLSSEASLQIRSIFRLQRQGAFSEAISSSTHLTDTLLLADIEADRYLNPAYHPSVAELRLWLKQYSTHADASAIWDRLAAITQQKSPAPLPPSGKVLSYAGIPASHVAYDFTRNHLLDRTLRERAGWGIKGVRSALRLIEKTPGMTPAYAAQLKAEAAQAMLAMGNTDVALEIARSGFEQTHNKNALAGFIAGLALWKKDLHAQAVPFFTKATYAENATPAMRAACAFWASRAYKKLGQTHKYHLWLQHAEGFTDTFYGLLASQQLHASGGGHDKNYVHKAGLTRALKDSAPSTPVLTEIDLEAVGGTEIGRRVFALLQTGEQERAERTIRRAWADFRDVTLARSFQLVAEAAGLHNLATEMAEAINNREAHTQRNDNTPLPVLKPRNGFTMDPALVYALTRLESNFDAKAVSGSGAHGLMQIMPLTADFIISPSPANITHRFEQAVDTLHDPSLNLEIGQRYVHYLADLTQHTTQQPGLQGGDMIRLLASYNTGPAALAKWERDSAVSSEDPFLYMELLPNAETREYVHRALSYLWIYASKMNLPKPSLQALAHNQWPDFAEETALANRKITLH
ncbi:transglycosylase SLT domain-containing protein [Acetobacter thailandicus]|uniref:transglycosylase SLT domain-containing protein n=1 Tax=Acetobacter thailandicus TaxID=1502842 RepID=UPI001BAC14F6|nr:lytic transglycosylase domain-containing protein [Acetobacter thailandicus]MBS0980082.1 lytic transglycosylase domain-containing protein [Acetobacter thailandicus]